MAKFLQLKSTKFLSIILIIAHITTFGPIRDVLAYVSESTNYKLDQALFNEGGNNRQSATKIIEQDTVGEPIAQKSQSPGYTLGSGYTYYIDPNPPTLLGLIPNQNWMENTSFPDAFDLDNYFQSFNGSELSYTVNILTPNPQITVSIEPVTHLVSFSQPQVYFGSQEVSFTATDIEYHTATSNVITLTVQGVENPPILDPLPDITVNETELVVVTPTAIDLDGDPITYTFGSPLDANGQWQTDYDDSGTYDAWVRATDPGGLYDEAIAHITVLNLNRPPILDPIAPITANEGDLITITPTATDPDGDEIIFYFEEPFNQNGIWLTDYDDAGDYTITVTAFDGIVSVYQDASVTVNNVNRAPIATLTLDNYTVNPNQIIDVQLTATDPDGDSMTFSLKKDGQEIASGPIANVYTTQISFSDPGDHTVEATVTDAGGLTGTDFTGVDVVDPNANNERINPLMGDFNGDALSDLGVFDSNTGTWEVAISDEGVFNYAVDWLTGFGTTTDQYSIGGDFNGDGLTDVGLYNNTNGECQVALSTGTSFTVSGLWLDFSDANYDWIIFMGNFNGDKYADVGFYNDNTGECRIALSNGSSFAAPTQWLTNFGGSDTWIPLTGDFNADGLTDICIFKKSTGEFKVAFSTTTSFVATSQTWITGFAVDEGTVISDFNGDGLTDVGYWDEDNFEWHYAISTGANFVDQGIWIQSFGTTSDDAAYTGDFDGNGVTDAAVFDREDIGINRWTVLLSQQQQTDLLIEINNGIGGITSIEYDYASQFENDLLPFPVYVSKAITLTDTLPEGEPTESYTQEFSYAGGYYDAEEREFRGFEKVTVKDPISQNYTQTYFYQGKENQNGALKGQIEKVLAYDGNDMLISQVINTWEVEEGGPESSILGFPYISEVNTTAWAENGSSVTVRSTFEYDNIGNILQNLNEGNIAIQGDEKTTESTYALAYEEGFNRGLQNILKDDQGDIVAQKDFEYDEKGNLTKETYWFDTDPENSPYTQYTYDGFGNILTTTNTLGQIVTMTYETVFDAFLQTVFNDFGHTITYEYDARFGAVTSITDSNNVTTTTDYDNFSRVINEINPDGVIVTSYSYPDFNTKITTQLTLEKTEYIDGLGRNYKTVSSWEDGDLRRDVSVEKTYNNRGQLDTESLPHYVDIVDPLQISYIRYTYDIRGRIIETINDFPGTLKDAATTVDYVSVFQTETVDPRGNRKGVVKDVHDKTAEVIEYTQGGVYHTYYEYDTKGNLLKVTDAQGNITEITYDSLDRKLTMSDPDMGFWNYEYNAVDNLIKQTDAKGQILEYEYDDLNRLTVKKDTTNSLVPVTLASYEYDYTTSYRTGRLSKVIDQSGSTEFFYDNLGREIHSKKTIDSIEYDVYRTYDILDRLLTLTYPDSEIVTYTYDDNSGLLESVVGSSTTYTSGITYSAQGQMENAQFGNNTSTQYTYGLDLRLSHIITQNQTTALQDLNYDFDKCGNLEIWTDNLRTNTRTYNYDELNRLTDAFNVPAPWGGYTDLHYQYNSIGNMIYKSDLGVMQYGFGQAGPHALTSAGGYSYSYDANGNMVSGRDNTMQYDVRNRLVQVVDSSGTTQFIYDGDGGRVKKIAPAQTNIYVGSLYEILTTETQETILKKHIFVGQNRIATIEIPEGQDTHTYYYHTDHLGSSNVITDETGAQVQHCEYTPYGALAVNEGTNVTNYKFTGKELDNTGLYYYSARYYDPVIGRFIQADTIVQSPEDPQTLNRYTYCGNNPLKYVDPTGHWFWIALIIGALIGGVSAGIQSGWDFKAILVGAAIGAISGVIGGGIGHLTFQALGNIGSSIVGGMAGGAVAGTLNAAYYGGDLMKGALLGAGFGALGGLVFGSISQLGVAADGSSTWQWGLARVGLSGIAGGGISELAGGDFLEGFVFASAIAGADFLYRLVTNEAPSLDPATGEGKHKLNEKGDLETVVWKDGSNNMGTATGPGEKKWWGKLQDFLIGETGPVMEWAGKNFPGGQGTAGWHDPAATWFRQTFGRLANSLLFNVQTMAPAYAINALGTIINQQPSMMGTYELYGEESND